MSALLMVAEQAHHVYTVYLADTPNNLTPEAPPGSNGLLKLVRWLMWLVFLAGMAAMIFAGGKFGWEKWSGVPLESPKMIAGAAIGGLIAASAGTIMNAVVLTNN
jgi:hypothetical protein